MTASTARSILFKRKFDNVLGSINTMQNESVIGCFLKTLVRVLSNVSRMRHYMLLVEGAV